MITKYCSFVICVFNMWIDIMYLYIPMCIAIYILYIYISSNDINLFFWYFIHVIPILHRDLCPGDYRLLLLFAYQQAKCSQHSLCTEWGASAQDESCWEMKVFTVNVLIRTLDNIRRCTCILHIVMVSKIHSR